jgi:hypothetical protein
MSYLKKTIFGFCNIIIGVGLYYYNYNLYTLYKKKYYEEDRYGIDLENEEQILNNENKKLNKNIKTLVKKIKNDINIERCARCSCIVCETCDFCNTCSCRCKKY